MCVVLCSEVVCVCVVFCLACHIGCGDSGEIDLIHQKPKSFAHQNNTSEKDTPRCQGKQSWVGVFMGLGLGGCVCVCVCVWGGRIGFSTWHRRRKI